MAYRKFSDIVKSEVSTPTPAKVAQVAKVGVREPSSAKTFAGFATFAGGPPRNSNATIGERADDRAVEATAVEAPVEAWRAGIARLRPEHPIGQPTRDGWATFLRDCHAFLAGEWAPQAATLGWDARALFGCHRERPWIVNWWGALWFIHGGEILAMTETTLSLKTIRGVRQSLRRTDITGYDFNVPIWNAHE